MSIPLDAGFVVVFSFFFNLLDDSGQDQGGRKAYLTFENVWQNLFCTITKANKFLENYSQYQDVHRAWSDFCHWFSFMSSELLTSLNFMSWKFCILCQTQDRKWVWEGKSAVWPQRERDSQRIKTNILCGLNSRTDHEYLYSGKDKYLKFKALVCCLKEMAGINQSYPSYKWITAAEVKSTTKTLHPFDKLQIWSWTHIQFQIN